MTAAFVSRETILAAPDIQTETVEVPEWGGAVRVRGMTAGERDSFDTAVTDARRAKKPTMVRARLVMLTTVDGEGGRLFTEADLPALDAKSGAALDRLWEVAARLSGIGARDTEDLEKN